MLWNIKVVIDHIFAARVEGCDNRALRHLGVLSHSHDRAKVPLGTLYSILVCLQYVQQRNADEQRICGSRDYRRVQGYYVSEISYESPHCSDYIQRKVVAIDEIHRKKRGSDLSNAPLCENWTQSQIRRIITFRIQKLSPSLRFQRITPM